MAKYIDETGLGTLWGQVKSNFYSINDLGINYDSETKKLQLLGKDEGTGNKKIIQAIDATPFVKDGVLSNVEIITVSGGKYTPEAGGETAVELADGKYIMFEWNTDADIQIDYLPVAELAKTYLGGDAIIITDDNKVDVKVDSAAGNFIQKTAAGIKVSGVTTDATKTKSDITIAGGPLAEELNSVFADGKIPANTSVEDVLFKLACKEIYPDGKLAANGTLKSAFAQPNVTVSSSGTVEVGTTVNIGAFPAYEPTPTATSRTYTGFTYGWSAADDDTKDGSGNPTAVAVQSVAMNTGTYSIKRTGTGGFSTVSVDAATGADAKTLSIPATTATVAEGANTVKFDISGPGHKGTVIASPEYYIVSNLGNTDSTKKVAAQAQQNLSNTTATAGTKTYSVTGAYKYFAGEMTTIPTTSSQVRGLALSNFFNGVTTISAEYNIKAGNYFIIAIPAGYKITNLQNSLGGDAVNTASKQSPVVVNLASGSTTKEYDIYAVDNTLGSVAVTIKNIKVSK